MQLRAHHLARPLALAALFAAGWWTGRNIGPSHTTTSIASAPDKLSDASLSHLTKPTAAEALARFAHGDRTLSRRELATLLRSASAAEIPDILDLVAKLPTRLDRDRFRAALLARWVAFDPTAARSWAEARPVVSDRRTALREVLTGMGQSAPAQAAAWVLTADIEGGDRNEVVREIMSGWLALAPAQAEAWLTQITDPDLRRSAIDGFISALAEEDPSAAFTQALALPTDRSDYNALSIAARALVERDPTSAATVLARIPAGEARNWVAVQVVDALSLSDPKLASEFALNIPAGYARNTALNNVMRAMAGDPAAVFTWIESAFPLGDERNLALQNAMGVLADDAPAEAARHLDRLPPDARAMAMQSLLIQWTEKDVAGATAWVKQLPPGSERNAAAEQLLRTRYQSDPAGTVDSLQRDFPDLPPDRVAAILSHTVVMSTGAGPVSAFLSGEQLLGLLTALPSDEARRRFLDSSLRQLASVSPAAAADLLAALPTEHRSESAVRDVASTWADSEPAAAAAWAMALSDITARRDACDSVLECWSRADPDAAFRWACGSTNEQLRTEAIYRIAGNWSVIDPAGAAEWAAHISDAKLRQSATEAVADIWFLNDFETAAQWLATADLPAERKAALLRKVRK